MIRRLFPRAAAIGLLALTSLAHPATAQGRGRDDANTLAAYQLTMPTVRKVLTSSREYEQDAAFQRFKDANPRWLRTLRGMSLAELQAEFEKHAAIRRAMARSGLSAREWTLAWAAIMKGMEVLVYEEVAKAEGKKPPATPFDVPKANVELLRRNQAEIDRLQDRG